MIMTYINRVFTEGTVSIIIGGHSVVHSVLVVAAWRRLYHRWPALWQLVCIFLHDIGHFGKNYLTSVEEKNQHWELGAWIAYSLFGVKGFVFIAGHTHQSGQPPSDLRKADKLGWALSPIWWLTTNSIFEPKLAMGYTRRQAAELFLERMKETVESGEYQSAHKFYLDRCQKGDRNV